MNKVKKGNFENIEKIATFLDSKFYIPFTKIKFGIDGIIGLIPGVGDIVSFIMSAGLIIAIIREGASGKVVVKMIGNIFLDTIIGQIPLLGDIFDVYFKSNKRNVALAKAHFEEGKHTGNGMGLILGLIVGMLVITGLLIWGVIKLFKASVLLF